MKIKAFNCLFFDAVRLVMCGLVAKRVCLGNAEFWQEGGTLMYSPNTDQWDIKGITKDLKTALDVIKKECSNN